ncbi:hypothetical protein [Planctomicrobium sp. SH527]|uniref:hypothetical protein n=1 Tax=Planctomicrobium sp. SH527 TaxID=3448123 RepID=UPI003F5B96C8
MAAISQKSAPKGSNQLTNERTDIYLPTPEEIQEACRSIQSEWTESERARRSRGQAGRQRTVAVTTRRYAKIHIDRSLWDGRAA